MSIKPPARLSRTMASPVLASLEAELAQERAATLGRLTRAFEEALAAFNAFEAEAMAPGPRRDSHRERLLDRAGEALWDFVVQREACSLRNTEMVLRELKVPMAVRLRMGVSRSLPTTRCG